jgi:glycerol-3-phosphate acyltransferase PlsY
MTVVKVLICALIGYALGNIQPGVLLSTHLKKKDVRECGSGGTGATNMLRTFGKGMGALTFLCDVLKGLLAAYAGLWIAGQAGQAAAGTMVVVGHVWPAIYHFKGGKGVASSLGVMLSVSPFWGLIAFGGAIVVAATTAYMSLGSLAGVSFGVLCVLIRGPWSLRLMGIALVLISFYAHRGNISRLRQGTENKLFKKKEKTGGRNLK